MPTHPKHLIQLTQEERAFLEQHTKSGDWTPRQVTRAKILLLADIDGPDVLLDEDICEQLGCSLSTVCKRRKKFARTGSVEDTIFDKPRTGRPTIIDGAVDAQMTTIACSSPPDGRAKWTLRLIRDRMVALEIIDEISHTTVARTLKKKEIKLWLSKEWKIPPKEDAAFVCHMERTLDIYQRPYDPNCPVVCFDETNKQHIADVMEALPVREGNVRKHDSEYKREGTSNIFMYFEPLAGYRHVTVRDRRTAIDFADAMKLLVDVLEGTHKMGIPHFEKPPRYAKHILKLVLQSTSTLCTTKFHVFFLREFLN